jgi:hypothetical protein
MVTPTFTTRPDGQVDVQLDCDCPLLNDALADSVSSLPPRGEDGVGPSTYWVDVALAGLERALGEGTDRAFAGGNATQFRVFEGRIEARYDYADDDESGEFIEIDVFRSILGEWRDRIVESASAATERLPDTYRRNPHDSRPKQPPRVTNAGAD